MSLVGIPPLSSQAAAGRGDYRLPPIRSYTVNRGTDPISAVSNYSPSVSAGSEIQRSQEMGTEDRSQNRGATQVSRREDRMENNIDRQSGSSASQTLSDLAAAASSRLMAENAAEIAAARAARNAAELAVDAARAARNAAEMAAARARSGISDVLAHHSLSADERSGLLTALRSSRDPFLGAGVGPPHRPLTNRSVSALTRWATSDEMDVIHQSEMRGLRLFQRSSDRSPLEGSINDEGGIPSPRGDYSSAFSHSPESSFVEVVGGRLSIIVFFLEKNVKQVS